MAEKSWRKATDWLSRIGCSLILTMLLLKAGQKYLKTSELAHSVWSILIFMAIYMLLRRYEGVKRQIPIRKKRFVMVFCTILALTETAGLYLIRDGSVLAYGVLEIGIEFLLFLSIAVILFLVFVGLKVPVLPSEKTDCRGRMWTDWLIIILGWFPVLLAYYPGIFAYDASDQVMQVLTGAYSAHHPLLHTLILGGLFRLGHILGNNNLGVLFYSIIQISVVAWAIAWALDYLKKKGIGYKGYLFLMLIYIFFPVNAMLAISTTKDILFSAFCLIVTIFLMKISEQPELWKKKELFFLGCLAMTGMMLFRNNAIYACILCIPLFCLFHRHHWKNYLGWIIISLAITVGINSGLSMLLQPEKGSIVEMLSVPLQQIARVGYYHSDELETEWVEELNYFIPEDVVGQYTQNNSDMIKNFIEDNRIKKEPFRFIKLYIRLGIAYPREYLDAFACLTQGFWYIEDTSHAQIYGVGMESRLGYILTNYKKMPKGYEVSHVSYFPQLEYLLEKLFSDNKYLEIPVLSVVFAPAFWGWTLFGYLLWEVYKKCYHLVIPVLPLACYHLTLLLGPVCIVRYVYPVMICMPIILIQMIYGKKLQKNEIVDIKAVAKK